MDSVEEQYGVFNSVASALAGSGKGKKKALYHNYAKIGLKPHRRHQGNLGSCVAHGTAGGVDTLKATEIANGDRELFVAPTAEEPIYYGARVKIGKNRIRGDGAIVAYAIKYIAEYGTLAKGKYGNIDLTTYSVDRCRKWGQGSGFPKTLEDISKDHLVLTFSRVKSWEEFRDSIYNDCPVIFGSRYGFSNETDTDGFCKQNTTWHHCMYGFAVDDESKRPGGCIDNSWGEKWLKQRGKRMDNPPGSFWCDAQIIDNIMSNGDCWSISAFEGYKKEKIDTGVAW
jgi:hypothetical protein